MTEDMDQERAIEFILDQQAKLAAGMLELKAGMVELRAGINDLRSVVGPANGVQEGFAQALLRTQKQIQCTQEQIQRTDEQLRRLSEAQLNTEEHLNNLIAIADDFFRRSPPQ